MIVNSSSVSRVAVTGMGAITSIGQTVPSFISSLLNSCSGVTMECYGRIRHPIPIARVRLTKFPSNQRLSHLLCGNNPIAALAIPALEEALEAAFGTDIPSLASAALIVGTTVGGIHALRTAINASDRASLGRLVDEWPAAAFPASLAAALDLRGPVLATGAACAAGAQAVIMGTQLIRNRVVERVLVGGYDPLSPYTVAGFSSLGAMARERVRPFDLDRDGLALGEGAGFLVLESFDSADSSGRVVAEIVGTGQSSDGYHLTSPDPKGTGMEQAVRAALSEASVDPRQIGYINAHGTGTRRNDKSECAAYTRVFGPDISSLPISSIKAAIGHTLGAGGVLEFIATIGSLRMGYLPPTLNFSNHDPECNIDCVPNARRPATVTHALSASAGFGGINAAVVVRLQ